MCEFPSSFPSSSERLKFRAWSMEDLPLATTLWGDEAVTRFIGGPFSSHQIAERLDTEISRQASYSVQYWPIFIADTFVGCAGLRPYSSPPSHSAPKPGIILEFGVHLRPSFWGQGLAEEAARAVIAFAFQNPQILGLFAGHNPDNHASRKMLERVGFVYSHDELYAPTGRMHPSYFMFRCSS